MTESKQSKLIISTAFPPDDDSSEAQDEGDNTAELELRRITVPVEGHGNRLDRTLAELVPEFSRNYLQQLIEAGMVRLKDQAVTKASLKVKAGDELIVELRPTPQSQAFKPEIMTLDIVYEDEYLYVINKPAGLVVHPAPGNWSGTLLNGLLGHDAQSSFLPRAGIVHRLDKDTSGLMVVARQRLTMDRLVSLIAAREVSREYLAVAHGAWKGPRVRRVDAAIGRDSRNRLRMAVVDLEKQSGKTASTDISLLQSERAYCLVQCKLHTGRTHQIRVHMASVNHPLVSDVVYGGAVAGGLSRQALHAWRLGFEHPVTGVLLEFKSEPPPDFRAALANLGLRYNQTL